MVLPTSNLPFLTGAAGTLLAMVAGGTLVLAATAMLRRWHHQRFERGLKSLCIRFALTPSALLESKYSALRLAKLRALPCSSLELLLEPLLIKCGSAAPLAEALRELCLELGLVDAWQRRLLGQVVPVSFAEALGRPEGILHYFSALRFVLRARSARNLGLLGHRESWPVLARALDDSHPDVQQVALRSLARLGEPQSFPAILERLDKTLTENRPGLSLHALKSAMVRFPISQAMQLLPALRHPHPRLRLAAGEILREMIKSDAAGKQALFQYRALFDRELAALAFDADSEVRAIAGELIAQFAVALPSADLCRRLEDPQWSVRLGALETVVQQPAAFGPDELKTLLCDPHRMVRQAAVRALLAHGPTGVSKLYELFLETNDEALMEQIIQELEASGMVESLLENFGSAPESLETRVVERLVVLRAGHYLQAEVGGGGRHLLRVLLEKSARPQEPTVKAPAPLSTNRETAALRNRKVHDRRDMAA
jgi:HEAT repeat protein